jgi:hypothetical protein
MIELCKLEGSPKQVAWGTEVRTNVIQTITLLNKQYSVHKPDRAQVIALGLERLLSQEVQASWWIDRRLFKPRAWEDEVKRLVSPEEANRIYLKTYGFLK